MGEEWPAGPGGLAQLGLWSAGPKPGGFSSIIIFCLLFISFLFYFLYIFVL